MSQLEPVGYEHLIRTLSLPVRPLTHPCFISGSVNRRVPAHNGFWFPRSVALEESLVGHLEFALRHEGLNLEVIDAVFEHLPEGELVRRFSASPNGAHIRRACFLWEWLTGKNLSVEVAPTGAYVDALPDNEYFTAGRPTNNPKFRVRDNLPGTPDFCPLVRRTAISPPSISIPAATSRSTSCSPNRATSRPQACMNHWASPRSIRPPASFSRSTSAAKPACPESTPPATSPRPSCPRSPRHHRRARWRVSSPSSQWWFESTDSLLPLRRRLQKVGVDRRGEGRIVESRR